jgi:DNA replication protein DnaC
LKSLLLQQRIIRPRFRWPLPPEKAKTLLLAAYAAEVELRHGSMENDKCTDDNIERVARILTAPNPKFGLLFCGVCGNGKTTMLRALQQATNYLFNNGYFKHLFGDERVGIAIVDARDLAQNISKDYTLFEKVRSRTLLALEDVGREPTEVLDYGNVLNPVVDLLEYRYEQQLFTVITTNLTPRELSEKYKQRIADRFREMLNVVVFENSSYRRQDTD